MWTGTAFRLGDRTVPVLSYEAGESGWTNDLTVFHENTAGANHPIDRASREMALRGLESVSGPHPVILEIGCSSGFFLRAGRERFPEAQWVGADYVREPLEQLAEHLPNVPLLHFDLLRCPLPDNCVDAIVVLNVLEHIPDDAAALRQLHRILKPGGVLVIEVPAGPELYDVYDKLLMHFRRYTRPGLERLVRGYGFEILRSSHLGALIYPAFYAVKQWNKRRVGRDDTHESAVVGEEIRSTSNMNLLWPILQLEMLLGRRISWPVGIRCVMTCRKAPA